MNLFVKIKNGFSAHGVIIGNVIAYSSKGDVCTITYKNPQDNYAPYDITIKHVESVEEVK